MILNRLFQRVVKVRSSGLAAEDTVRIGVHVTLWRSRQPDKKTVEICEYGTVFVENRTVRFVNDNQIESARSKPFVFLVDVVDHCLIGTEHQPGIIVLFLAPG